MTNLQMSFFVVSSFILILINFHFLFSFVSGDGFSDLIGRKYGTSNRLQWNSSKSYAGSLAFILFGFVASLCLLMIYHSAGYFLHVSYVSVFGLVCLCALVESISPANIDNWTIFLTVAFAHWMKFV